MRRMTARRNHKRLENQRGVTLVLMTLMIVVLMGSAAFAVDFGRMYLFRAQLKAATDAAAHAGAVRVSAHDYTGALDTALNYGHLHIVQSDSVVLNRSEVIPGTWTTGGGWVADPGGIWGVGTTAVQAVGHYTANYSFGRIFGLTSHTLTDTSRAAIGYIGATTCIRPTALPYQSLLDQIYPPGTKDASSYPLSEADIERLKAATIADSIQLRITDSPSSPTSGNYYGISLGPVQFADGTTATPVTNGSSDYDTDFGGACSGTQYRGGVGPGDWLQPQNGVAAGPVERGFEILCGVSVSGPGYVRCPTPQPIKVAIWAPHSPVPALSACNPTCFWVKYTGVFYVTGYTKQPGAANPDGIWGYFSAMPTSGSFTSTPGPLLKIALVR